VKGAWTEFYIHYILENAPRVLTQIDRDPDSRTFGDCDRNHWHLSIRDFSSGILQQSALTLALLFTVDFEENPYYKNSNVKLWAVGCVQYWANIQLRDGSFNEYYPHEHGFPPTAFSLFAICETYKILHMEDTNVLKAIAKASAFLLKHEEKNALNQAWASVAALYSSYTLLNHNTILTKLEEKVVSLIAQQSSEGWFLEHGGADIGYLSVTLDMMAEYYWMSRDNQVKVAIDKAVEFYQYFIHPDKTIGGEYASRKTTNCLPNGFQVAALKGNIIAANILKTLYSDNSFMNSIDDRYLAHYVAHSFLRALEKDLESDNCLLDHNNILPHFRNFGHEMYFKHAGLLSKKTNCYSAFVGVRKGGILKVFSKNKEMLVNCGYRIHNNDNKILVTNWQFEEFTAECYPCVVFVSGRMKSISQKVTNPIINLGLRISSFVFGKKINTLLKKILILNDRLSSAEFSRKIVFDEESVFVEDHIKAPFQFSLIKASNMSMRVVASGKYFMPSDLLANPGIIAENIHEAKITTEVDMRTGSVREVVNTLA
jgi:hypothetical protein